MMRHLLALLFFISTPAFAAPYAVDYAKSELAFSGVNSGKPFRGVFGAWKASIMFDAAKLADSYVNVMIDTASAKTGDAMIDATLPQADWFDASHFPQAKFESSTIKRKEDGSYRAVGTLKIRDTVQPVAFDFTLTPPDATTGASVVAKGTFTLSRHAFKMGAATDPEAKWVADTVRIELVVVATQEKTSG